MTPRPTIAPAIEPIDEERLTPLFNVVLLDDDDHTYDYVIEMLGRLFMTFSGSYGFLAFAAICGG